MEIFGRVIHAMEMRSGVSASSGKSWTSREYVLEVPNGQYKPRHLCFAINGEDRIKRFNLQKDEQVTIQFDIDAREYNGRWFNSITAYNVIRPGMQYAPPQPQPYAPQAYMPQPYPPQYAPQPQVAYMSPPQPPAPPQGQPQMPPGEYPPFPQQARNDEAPF